MATSGLAGLAGLAGQSVLVIHDDKAMRDTVVERLREAGYTVSEALDSERALVRLYASNERLVVLVDVRMPGMDRSGGMDGMDGTRLLQAVATRTMLATRHAYILMVANESAFPFALATLVTRLRVAIIANSFTHDEVARDELAAAVRLAQHRLEAAA